MAIIKVITNNDLSTGVEIVANKLRAKVDGTSITVNGSGELTTVLAPSVINDLVTLSGVAVNSQNLGTFTGSTIPDNQTLKAAIQALETAHEALNIMGQYAGSAATFAALPATTSDGKPVNTSDWAILTTDDGANQSGIYVYNGTDYTIGKEIPEVFTLNVLTSNSNNITFSGNGTSDTPLSAVVKVDSVAANNRITSSADGLRVAQVEFIHELQDLASNTLGYISATATQ